MGYEENIIDLPIEEIHVLAELEKITGKILPLVDKIMVKRKMSGNEFYYEHHFGFTVKDKHISGLGLCSSYFNPLLDRSVNNFNHVIHMLPKSFKNLKHLEFLDLCGNDLIIFVNTFEDLDSIKTLILSNNNLDSLPNTFVNMKQLNILDLSNNIFAELPIQIGYLVNLKKLCLEGNPFKNESAEFAKKDLDSILKYCNRKAKKSKIEALSG